MQAIVKVEVPAGVGNKCLVQDRQRKHISEQPLLNHVRKALNGDAKGYFRAAWSSVVGWGISQRVADQDW